MTAIGALFLLGPLVVVPLGLRLIDARGTLAGRLHAVAIRGSLGAALALGLALTLPPGGPAAVLALPWIVVALAHLGAASASAAEGGRRTRQASAWIDLIGAAFLVVGAGWIAADRLGLQPLGFDPMVVRLTAVHFHFAGFALLVVAGRLIDRLGARAPRLAAGSAAIGVPLVALGFLGLPVAGLTGVLAVAAGGAVIGALQLRAATSMGSSAARWLGRFGGASLFVTMPMAVLWQLGQVGWLPPIHWLDLTTMIRVHGVLNALGFAVPSVVAWTLDRPAFRAQSSDCRGVGATARPA